MTRLMQKRSRKTGLPPGTAVHIGEKKSPLFYTGQSACLFDSLVLIEFLAGHGIYPTWVFGVRAAPFGPHCWVQHEDVVLNDVPEEVLNYTPILII